MSHITIREARKEDIEKVYKIEKLSFPYPYSPWDFRYYLEVEREFFLVAEKENELVGYIVSSLYNRLLTIVSLAVTPERRREGIATRLLTSIEEKARNKANIIELQVRVSNKPAISLYEKTYFEKIGKISNYYRDGENAYLFRKKITG